MLDPLLSFAWIIPAICLLASSNATSESEAQKDLERSVLANYENLNGISAEWSLTMTKNDIASILPKWIYRTEGIHESAYEPELFSIAFSSGRFRYRREFNLIQSDEKGTRSPTRMIKDRFFDGTRLYDLTRKKGTEPWKVVICFPSFYKPEQTHDEVPIMQLAGFAAANEMCQHRDNMLIAVHQLARSESAVVSLSSSSPNGLEWNRGKTHVRYQYDASHGFSVSQVEVVDAKGKLVALTKFTDFKNVDSRGWLPCEGIHTVYQWKGNPSVPQEAPLIEWRIKLDKAKLVDFSDSDFVPLEFRVPGMRVADATLLGAESTRGGFIDYEVPAKEEDLDRVIQEAMANRIANSAISPFFRIVLLGTNMLLFVGIIFWLVRRRKKARLLLLFMLLSGSGEVVQAQAQEAVIRSGLVAYTKLDSIQARFFVDVPADSKRAMPSYRIERSLLAKSPCFLCYDAAKSKANSGIEDDLTRTIAIYNLDSLTIVKPFVRIYHPMDYPPEGKLLGSLESELFVTSTGLWPLSTRRGPEPLGIPFVLRDLAYSTSHHFHKTSDSDIPNNRIRWEADGKDILYFEQVDEGVKLMERELYKNGNLLARYTLRNHILLLENVWCPTLIRNEQFDPINGALLFSAEAHVTDASAEPPNEKAFEISPNPGWVCMPSGKPPVSYAGGLELISNISRWIQKYRLNTPIAYRFQWSNLLGWKVFGTIGFGFLVIEVTFRLVKKLRTHSSTVRLREISS